jgi:hypothetical protein
MAKHHPFECKIKKVSANRATNQDINKPGKVLENLLRKIAKVKFTSTNSEDESDEESRYQGSFGSKAIEDGHVLQQRNQLSRIQLFFTWNRQSRQLHGCIWYLVT